MELAAYAVYVCFLSNEHFDRLQHSCPTFYLLLLGVLLLLYCTTCTWLGVILKPLRTKYCTVTVRSTVLLAESRQDLV